MTTQSHLLAHPIIRAWIAYMSAQRLSLRTLNERVGFICRICAALGVEPDGMDAARIVQWCSRKPWAPNTAHTYWTHLHTFHAWLCKQGQRDDNPMDLVPAPRRPIATPRPISTRQLAEILRACSRRRTRAMVLLAALAGLRAHEVAKIRGEDIDLDRGLLWVTGKGNVTATIPLHPLLAEVAATMPRRGHWFTTYVGAEAGEGPIGPKAVGKAVADAMLRAGVPGNCHQLRHWYGTTLLNSGTDLRTTQTLMRHASVATTQRYTAVRDERRTSAVERLDPFYDDIEAA